MFFLMEDVNVLSIDIDRVYIIDPDLINHHMEPFQTGLSVFGKCFGFSGF